MCEHEPRSGTLQRKDQPTEPMTRDSRITRRDILAAADELFYGEGFRSVSVDEISAKAGITKKTLYYHFRSKDELIAAYLEARDRPTLERFHDGQATKVLWPNVCSGCLAASADAPNHRRGRDADSFAPRANWPIFRAIQRSGSRAPTRPISRNGSAAVLRPKAIRIATLWLVV